MKNIKIIIIDQGRRSDEITRFFSFNNYFLKAYFEEFSKSKDKYNWLPPLQLSQDSIDLNNPDFIESFIKDLLDENISILGVSVYTWNKGIYNTLCPIIKKSCPGIQIIAGGPEIDAHRNTEFFTNNPYYDWAIFGDGEEAFTLLLDKLSGIESILINTASPDGVVSEHRPLMDKEFISKTSPYLIYKEEIKAGLDKVKKYYELSDKKVKLVGVWETTKGCPYTCTFCDWSSGLHNKVRFWGTKPVVDERPNFQKELDLFTELGFTDIMWTNPNVGLSPADSSIVDYWCYLKQTNVATPNSYLVQLSKLKKEKAYPLYKKLLKSGVESILKFDVQDLDPVVLKNIQRPEIPWEEHKRLILEMLQEFPEQRDAFRSKVNLIWGLPGQTHKHLHRCLKEITELGLVANYFNFELLPNAPAYTKEYIAEFDLQFENINVLYEAIPKDTKIITKDIINRYTSPTRLVTGSYSMNRKEWVHGVFKNYIYRLVIRKLGFENIDKLLDKFYLYDGLFEEYYEHFNKTNMIAAYPNYLFRSDAMTYYWKNIFRILNSRIL